METKKLGMWVGLATATAATIFVVRGSNQTEESKEVQSAPSADTTVAKSESEKLVTNNFVPAVSVREGNDKKRKSNFGEVGNRFEAEGVTITDAGKMTIKSQFTDGSIATQLTAARVDKASKASTSLKRAEKVKGVASKQGDRGSVRFDGYFDGVDLEYRYDGKDVEEFFHVSSTLKDKLVNDKSELVVTSVIPGVFRENGDIIVGTQTTEVIQDDMEQGEHPLTPQEMDREMFAMGDVELNTAEGDRFGLPAAYAVDATGEKKTLKRHFKWTPKGLEIAVHLDPEWVAQSKGDVMIDPSVVDSGRALNLMTWNERNFVKDSTGRFHLGYNAVYNGRWIAAHSTADASGSSWSPPDIVQPSYGPAENRHYAPELTIDSRDTVHVMFGDHGAIASQASDKGSYTSWGHRIRYANCENRCQSGQWRPTSPRDQLIIVQTGMQPTAARHQSYYTMAVDQQDTVHMTWAEWGVVSARRRYFQRTVGGLFTEKQAPGWHDIHARIVVDNTNQVHYFGSDYWNNYSVVHYAWDRTSQTWGVRPEYLPRRANGGNGGRQHNRDFKTVVDSNNNIHLAVRSYDRWHEARYRIWYGRFDSNSQAWADVEQAYPDDSPATHNYAPSVTVDDNNRAHLVWHRNVTPSNQLMYANKVAGQPWSTATRLIYSTGTTYNPQIRPRLSFPTGPNNNVTPNIVDVLVVENGDRILYISTGAPVEGPQPMLPLDHSFTQDTTPTLEWRRISSDNGTNVDYEIQLADSPLFTGGGGTVIAIPGNANTYTVPAAIADGQYRYWRVRAKNSYAAGPWGPIYELGVDTTPPASFNLLTPANNSDPGTRTPRFTWEPAVDPN